MTWKDIDFIGLNRSHGNECEQELYEMADITDGIVDNVQGYLTAERVIEILEEER
ncbi:hypothetical protein [Staphylococcus pseudintermedius]|uniref:hypothetical protein n=1 Tax=Staphylococcus pseudintermedius TaxID=283734 RepID=UPI0015DEAD75|nr:hypothetical protein [Staphylococcus pseudintermedius]EGQ3323199.1 hypothetical protein [Staphylococcus pseudintermedius]EGQ3508646.1 hypothetical protein [Staphylococcus pseudintermedius]EGQ3742496.1 hypothetical protein [Staphylococcus pseudintermedius]EHA6084569.1 hypothetical protein [Staphylococcus pseudintermedius]EHE7456201.1 hypothetical protein [Staphylococcus pseudintermedius]